MQAPTVTVLMKSVYHYYMQVRHSMQVITIHYFKKLKPLVKKMPEHMCTVMY